MTPASATQRSLPERTARVLLPTLAFTAWSLTGPAHLALAGLVLLFLADLATRRDTTWPLLRREPGFWLLVLGCALTTALAARAALLFPETAGEQWHAVWSWTGPLLFFVVAWWIARDLRQVWWVLAAALLGLAFGVLRKGDWSLLPELLAGRRYEFGYATLGIAFLAGVMLVGLAVFRRRFAALRLGGRPRPALGWALWGAALAFFAGVLAVTQSRGAVLTVAAAGLAWLPLVLRRRAGARTGHGPRPAGPPRAAAALGIGLLAMGGLFFWATAERQLADLRSLVEARSTGHLSYASSVSARIGLHRIALPMVAERPLLGWGPGTQATQFVVPSGRVRVSDYDREHAPSMSHLHSVALEVLVRFGLVGALFAAALGVTLWGAYRHLWRDPRAAPDLRLFLALAGLMSLLFCFYDFRIVHVDFRFLLILLLGTLYAFKLAPPETGQRPGPPGP